ncbi:MAG: hypothetical protein WC783_04235 [Candidatus Paceibacterota bacterium]
MKYNKKMIAMQYDGKDFEAVYKFVGRDLAIWNDYGDGTYDLKYWNINNGEYYIRANDYIIKEEDAKYDFRVVHEEDFKLNYEIIKGEN